MLRKQFRKKRDRIGTQIGNITITLTDRVEQPEIEAPSAPTRIKGGTATIRVLDADGELVDRIHAHLEEHLSNADARWLSDFLDRVRAAAEREVLA